MKISVLYGTLRACKKKKSTIYIVQFHFEDVHASLVSQIPSPSNPLNDPKCNVLY